MIKSWRDCKFLLINKNHLSKMKFFGCQGIFFISFDFRNEFENEFKDNNEKSCSWSRNRVCHKIDFKAVWPHETIPTAWELTCKSSEAKYNKSENEALRTFSAAYFGQTIWKSRSYLTRATPTHFRAYLNFTFLS